MSRGILKLQEGQLPFAIESAKPGSAECCTKSWHPLRVMNQRENQQQSSVGSVLIRLCPSVACERVRMLRFHTGAWRTGALASNYHGF